MEIEKGELKSEPFEINDLYVGKTNLCNHTIGIDVICKKVDFKTSTLNTSIRVVFTSKSDKVNLVSAMFYGNAKADMYAINKLDDQTVVYFYFLRLIEDVKQFLSNIPDNMIEISPPLIIDYDIRKVSESVLSELKALF